MLATSPVSFKFATNICSFEAFNFRPSGQCCYLHFMKQGHWCPLSRGLNHQCRQAFAAATMRTGCWRSFELGAYLEAPSMGVRKGAVAEIPCIVLSVLRSAGHRC